MIQQKIICVVFALLILFPIATVAINVAAMNNSTKDVIVSQTINQQADISDTEINKQENEEHHKVEFKEEPKEEHTTTKEVYIKNLGTFKVTAYCDCEKCNGRWAGQTAMGVKPKVGVTVAVDKKVIPLGTKLYIEGIGEVIAHDTGVKGRTIDLFLSSHQQAKIWGVKMLNVSIVK